jgi:hypothetical protein
MPNCDAFAENGAMATDDKELQARAQLSLRRNKALRQQIEDAANRSRRTMNAERSSGVCGHRSGKRPPTRPLRDPPKSRSVGLMSISFEPSKEATSLEPARSVAQRLGRSVRTIERWVKAGILPPPMQVRGRNLHRAGVMPTADDARKATASEAAASAPSTTR